MRRTVLYSSFDFSANWLCKENSEVSNGKASLTNVTKTLIRANDFVNNDGSPFPMPVLEYPTSGGKYVGCPPVGNKSYYWNYPSASFGNLCMIRLQSVSPVAPHTTVDQRYILYPKEQGGTYHTWYPKRYSNRDFHYKTLNSQGIISGSGNYRITAQDEWTYWDNICMNKYLYNSCFFSDKDPGLIFHNIHDPLAVNPSTPRGRLNTENWLSPPEELLRSPGCEYEDTNNPAILQLWPYLYGYVIPKNDAGKIWIVTPPFKDAYDLDNAELTIKTPKSANTRHIWSGTLDGISSETGSSILTIGVNETFSFDDGILFGGLITFPDFPDEKPKRVYGGGSSELYIIEDISNEIITDGTRYDLQVTDICPIYAEYPINESSPVIYPVPYSGDLTDVNNFDATVFALNKKYVVGSYFNNYIDFQNGIECLEITITGDPCYCSDYIAPISPEENEETMESYDLIAGNSAKIEEIHDEGERNIFEFLKS